MGLMLSVLVFFVGVVEVLDCWHHFLLHLIHPPQKSILYHSKTDLLSTRELHTPIEARRSSHVDICWPRDISPTDDLHVIKKRHHSESVRSSEHDEISSIRRRSKGKIAPNDQDKSLPENFSPPQIIIQCPDSDEPAQKDSPVGSRESSPNYLELSVIVESDSSSEFDEPSQIENPEYRKRIEAESLSSSLKPDNEIAGSSQVTHVHGIEDNESNSAQFEDENTELKSEVPCQVSSQSVNEGRTQCELLVIDKPSLCEASSKKVDLPIFTDAIVSQNVTKVTFRHAPEIKNSTDASSVCDEGISTSNVDRNDKLDTFIRINEDAREEHNVPSMSVVETYISLNDLPLSVDEDIQNSPASPKITLKESSPIPCGEDEDSDSSLNTSDASFLVKSRTSDRPLKIRFLSPEEIAREFISVTKVDLKTLGSRKGCGEPKTQEIGYSHAPKTRYTQAPEELQLEAERVVDDIIERAISYLSKGTLEADTSNKFNGVGCYIAENDKSCGSNSSLSSLSGIPQLPEDFKDCDHLNLPSNNGYANTSPGGDSFETSYSIYDNSESLPSNGVVETIPQDDHIEVYGGDRNVNGKGGEALNTSNVSDNLVEVCNEEVGSSKLYDLKCGDEISISNISDNKLTDTLPGQISFKDVGESSENCKSSKELDSRHPSSSKSSNSEEVVFLCRAKESATGDQGLDKGSVRTTPPAGSLSGPSTSGGAGANPEDKAFWLIFSGEYTKAMGKDWHSGHFCCWQCDESLTGQRYVLRDEHPYCIKCYESVFANGCEECSKTIGIDSKDLSYKDKHWHEACFLCNKCRVSLVDKQFGSKLDKIFCGNCYDAQFASRCDGCGNIFKAGTKKMEYKTRQWHEPCFACCVCKSAIGTKSFIPREQEIYCATCYEEKFATRCVKCNKIITSGGVTYKNEPWHRECFTCTNCSTSLAGQRFTSKEEKPYCADCFGELFAKRCTACCKPITGIGGTRFVSFEDRHWHNDCFVCASCKSSLVGRGFITDGDDIICPECAKQKLM